MDDLHARAKRGIKLLMGRQVVLQILTFAGGVVLARVLEPAEFGLYAIATFLVGTFALLGDFGLAPSFIQRKEELTDRDLQVGFTLQQLFTTVIVGALLLSAPWLAALYPRAPMQTVWLVRVLALSLYLTSWRSMSALQLERQLCYEGLAWIEVAETLSYQSIAVGLAVGGCGVWSFVWATLTRGILGAVLVYRAAPWPVRFRFDKQVAGSILRFGIPFQLGMVANQARTWITPLVVGGLIGPQAVGFLMWASSNGQKPLTLVDNVMRVAFPHFSRLQENRAEVECTLLRYLTYLLLPAGLWFSLLLVAGPSLVRWIYTDKWTPAVPALVLSAALVSVNAVGWVVVITLNSLGFARFTARIALLRSAAYIVLSIPLVYRIGFNGEPVAQLAAAIASVPWMFGALGRGASRRVLGPIAWVLLPAAVSTLVGGVAARSLLPPPWQAVVLTSVVASVYLAVVWLTGPIWFKDTVLRKLAGRVSPLAPVVAQAES